METIALTEGVFYILLSLFHPLHGYGIMQHVAALSGNRVVLAAGTLYGAITTLLEKGWIIPVTSEETMRKKEYIITGLGKAAVEQEIMRLEELLQNGRAVIGREAHAASDF